ncbi:MAG: hypothetical protein M1298_05710 [Chloroflexi bacterium]|nr:hypothetical protein [Chloroflexota bacterium]
MISSRTLEAVAGGVGALELSVCGRKAVGGLAHNFDVRIAGAAAPGPLRFRPEAGLHR